jgi:hypothetical protein
MPRGRMICKAEYETGHLGVLYHCQRIKSCVFCGVIKRTAAELINMTPMGNLWFSKSGHQEGPCHCLPL